ncbi:MAG: ADP-ribosylation factor family protein [Candidatus Helarchaeota archaeon]
MSFLKRLFGGGKKKVNLALIGLDNAGKSTTLNFLISGEHVETVPTMGVNYERIKLKKLELNMIDLGGQVAFRKFWAGPLQNSQCLIFVIDGTDRDRFQEAKDEFYNSLEIFSKKFPIIILVNKQDLPNAAPKEEIIDFFELTKLQGRDWHILDTSAITGKGLVEAFQWIYEHISGDKIKKALLPRDIIIFDEGGIPIISKSQVFKEGDLAAGLLSAINTFIKTVSAEKLTSLTMGKYKIIFQHVKELIGAIILNVGENEQLASELLEKLLGQLIYHGLENAEKILYDFYIKEIKK